MEIPPAEVIDRMSIVKLKIERIGELHLQKEFEELQKAVEELKISDKVEYLTGTEGIQKIIQLGSMNSPILVIDDEIAMTGFTPDIEKIKEKIKVHIR